MTGKVRGERTENHAWKAYKKWKPTCPRTALSKELFPLPTLPQMPISLPCSKQIFNFSR